jgi:hypothetical protein
MMVVPDPLNDRRQGPPAVREAVLIAGCGLVLVAVLAWWIGRPSTRDGFRARITARAASDREPSGAYIGSRACRECHPGESAFYTRSGHARTLRPAAGLSLARRLDGRVVTDPERPGVTWSYALRDDRFRVARDEAGAVERFVVDYAFGSDHHATTFLTLTDPATPTALEHRLTHYASGDSFGITPGQRAERPFAGTTPHGRELTPAETLKCFRCHATRTSASGGEGLDLDDLIPNVSCERCHGPARAHVAAARAGRTDLSMPFGDGNWTTESQLALCGQCHRHPSRASPGLIRPDNTALARFQPVGLMQSKCYTRSDGAFSCVTCHEPHRRSSTDRVLYEITCIKCHEATRKAGCPVSPRSGCIDCHMPKIDSGQHVLFTDHWIRVRETSGPRPDR